MSRIQVNFEKTVGPIKVMHAVNNGPVVAGTDQTRGNQDDWLAAKIPYARNHDASFYAGYGGEHTVDVHAIFPNFDADENDPQSYDFACTDEYLCQIIRYGTEPFYRLGSKIEHEVKKYGTVMPKDFHKWAVICEHIIRHYTEGWANGFTHKITYWEIWNEPDLDPDGAANKRTWSGTEADFARLYVTAAKHLKACFPHLKIGGPASVGDEAWMDRFLTRIRKENAPLDFFSWHWYWTQPDDMSLKGSRVRRLLEKHGYGDAQSILNEWNYVRGWSNEFVYSIEQIIGMKGAAFTSAVMAAAQHNPDIDMLMYYDARPGTFNGLFDYYTQRPLKGYYPFLLYAKLYALQNQAESIGDDPDVYAVCAKNGDKTAMMITYYAEDDNKGRCRLELDVTGADMTNARFFLLDPYCTMAEKNGFRFENGKAVLTLEKNSILYIEA